MSQVAKSVSALERAFLAILELEGIEIRLFRRLKLASFDGNHRTHRSGYQLTSVAFRLLRGDLTLPPLKRIVINLSVNI